ncbi:hypothetical protein LDENG_00209940, partial [Lucifuga dentata]
MSGFVGTRTPSAQGSRGNGETQGGRSKRRKRGYFNLFYASPGQSLIRFRMAHSKPLFIPWLRGRIDSGRYPGVAWTNAEKTEFSIPWKHALRQDSSSDDVLIFK